MNDLEKLRAQLPQDLAKYAEEIYGASIMYRHEPRLVAALMSRESGAGKYLVPQYDPAGWGDNGNGFGLFQIDKRFHASFLAAEFPDGSLICHEPAFQALYAAEKLRTNLIECGGNLFIAIAAYNCKMETALHAAKQIASTVTGSTDPAEYVAAQRKALIAALDAVTTGHDYVSDVLKRRDQYLAVPVLEDGAD